MYINRTTPNFNIRINKADKTQHNIGVVPGNDKSTGESKDSTSEATDKLTKDLTPKELEIIEKLQARDQEVRDHEMAHVAAGGSYVKRGAKYEYQKGPDGILYAIGGDVLIDTSAIPGDPEATIKKMEVIKSAALAPASPSGADRAIASKAGAIKMRAQEELIKLQLEKSNIESSSKASKSEVSKSYINSQQDPPNPGSFINFSG